MPKALILVPSCKKADDVEKYLRDMLLNVPLKVLKIYGCDDRQVVIIFDTALNIL